MQKTFLKKVGFIFCLSAFLVLVDACHGANCDCPTITKEFFDFQSTSIEVEQNNVLSGTVARISVVLEDLEFLVEGETPACRQSWFINSAFACSCLEEGNEGLKFPVTDIRVFSNADYSEEISAGQLLDDIVTVNLLESIEQGALSSVEDKNRMFTRNSEIQLYFYTPPTVDSTHTFTVEIVKGNGTIVSSEASVITWL